MAVYLTGDTHGDFNDNIVKRELADLLITLFCIHGNYEERTFY